ncbi:hypothetical protein [Stutzerimonas stutzeri]|jgi:hypothetical protein|uniref:TubC N-terminal docking domain-containing protein n=1 Tax=Stutzerimonas stutzeri TaxID=316 RepID=A0A2N8RH65_STUST|nr:hypothetical protein [Stutzerimonas stutzeri]MCQ4253357.1 hypothetical protein [Stutzerimonas stutzeri]PNF60434.1 hypothetical protein CXK99_06960 [Stutzerimonas stutzeri]
MAAIDYLRDHGFSAKVKGNRLIVSPSSKLTPDIRQYIKLHRLELLAEVAANDGESRRSHWAVTVEGYPPFTMICEPVTHAEALADARKRWPDATVQ